MGVRVITRLGCTAKLRLRTVVFLCLLFLVAPWARTSTLCSTAKSQDPPFTTFNRFLACSGHILCSVSRSLRDTGLHTAGSTQWVKVKMVVRSCGRFVRHTHQVTLAGIPLDLSPLILMSS